MLTMSGFSRSFSSSSTFFVLQEAIQSNSVCLLHFHPSRGIHFKIVLPIVAQDLT